MPLLSSSPITVADIDLRAPMQHEFVLITDAAAAVDPARRHDWRRLPLLLLTDMSGMRRLLAPHYAWACRADVRAAMLADHRQSDAALPAVTPDVFDWVSNPVGSILARIAPPDYSSYLNRNLDHAAGLRATRELLLARRAGLAGEALRARLARELPAGPLSYRFDADGRHLRMPYYAPRPQREEQVWPSP